MHNQAPGFWKSPFMADVKLWSGTVAMCLFLAIDIKP